MYSKPFQTKSQKKQILRLYPSLARQLLHPLFAHVPGVIEHRTITTSGWIKTEFYSGWEAFLSAMPGWSVRVHHYFGVATRKDSSSGKKENLSTIVCFHADVDFGPGKKYTTKEDALAAIESFPLRPSAVVDTGNGFHVYWFLAVPLSTGENLARVEAINKGIGQSLGGDPVGDASRILRVPGTWNVKGPANPKLVRLLWREPDHRYTLEEFAAYEVRQPERNRRSALAMVVDYGEMGGTAYGRTALADEIAALAGAASGDRNNHLNRTAFALGQLVGAGLLDRVVVENLLGTVAGNIGLSEREVRATVRSGLEAGMKEPRTPERRQA